MTLLPALLIVGAVLLGATVVGIVCAKTSLRVRHNGSEVTERLVAQDLGIATDGSDTAAIFGEQATLVQFSTQFCSKCPGTARLLSSEASELDGVEHIEIDLTDNIEVARRFNVLQTPTTLLLDGEGRVRARITGAPTASVIRDELGKIGALSYQIERVETAS